MKALRVALLTACGFLALSALAGGVGLVADLNTPAISDLEGSPFSDYTVPGLALGILVGGVALVATIALARRLAWGVYAAFASGVAILVFEIVEVATIGSPAGVARNLQVLYFSVGVVIVALAVTVWARERQAPPPA